MTIRILTLLAAFAISTASAQTVRPPRGWSFAVAAGGSAFTDFQRGTVRATRVDATGRVEEREFPRSVGAQTAGTVSGSIAYWPSGNWGVRVHALVSGSRFETMISQRDAQFSGAAESSKDSLRLPGLSIRSYQGQLLFRMPAVHARVMPYGIVGGGVVKYVVGPGDQPLPPEARNEFEAGYRLQAAGSIGLGAMLNMRKAGWALNFELNDRFGRTPVRGSGTSSKLSGNMELIPTDEGPADPVKMTSAVSFTVGLSWLLNQ